MGSNQMKPRNTLARSAHYAQFLPMLVALVVVAALVWPLRAGAAEGGVIEGQLVLKGGSGGVAGTTVLLAMANPTAPQPEERTTTAGEDGHFRFENVPLGADYVYLLRVAYEGGNYFQEVEFPSGATTVRAAPLELYPATRESGTIVFPRLRMIVSSAGDRGLQVVETGAFVNSSDRAYIGPPNSPNAATLRFGLPRGASNLQIAQGLNRETLIQLDAGAGDGFATLEAVPPGERQFAYLYRLPVAGDAAELDRVFPYQTATFQIFLPAGARLEGGGATFQDNGETTLQNNQRFRLYTAQNLAPDTRLRVRFTRLPVPGEERNPLIVPLLIFLLVLGVGLVVVYGRRRSLAMAPAAARPQPARGVRTVPAGAAAARKEASVAAPVAAVAGSGAAEAPDLEAERRRLLHELVDLDERYEAGTLVEPDYRRRRAARKGELLAVMRALDEGSRQVR